MVEMLAVGLSNHLREAPLHSRDLPRFAELVLRATRVIRAHARPLGAGPCGKRCLPHRRAGRLRDRQKISGDGMNPSVTGCCTRRTMQGGPELEKVAVLGRTRETYGNAFCIRMADVATLSGAGQRRSGDQHADRAPSTLLGGARILVVTPSGWTAAAKALPALHGVTPEQPQVVPIRNPLELERIWMY